MRIGIFAKTFEGSTPEAVMKAAGAAGFHDVQYNMACSGIGSLPRSIAEVVVADIANAMRSTGVGIAGISATYNMVHPDPAVRDAGRDAFTAIARVAKQLGTDLLSVCTGSCDAQNQWRYHPNNDSSEAWRDMIGEMSLLVEIAERHEVLIGVEPELANIVSNPAKARMLIDTLPTDRIRIVLDPANLFETASAAERQTIIASAVDLLSDRIAMAHAKDRTADGGFTGAGLGVIDFAHFLGALKSTGFSGPVVTHGLEAKDAPAVARYLSRIVDEIAAR